MRTDFLMAIATRCPHCNKGYSLKDELAGKRVTCSNPSCKKIFAVQPAVTVPAPPGGSNGSGAAPRPAPKPAVNVEEMALAAFSDEPAMKEAAPEAIEGAPIKVKCKFCD